MNAPRPRSSPRTGTPAAGALVPPQAGSPETGSTPSGRLAYSVDEAARLTGLSRDLLYDEMRRGSLGYLKVGRRRLITRQHLEQFLGITPSTQPTPASGPEAANRAPRSRP